MTQPLDPLLKQSYVDALLERTVHAFSQTLYELATALNPFPAFLDLESIQALEVEPEVPNPHLGCVVVCPDGKLYELTLRMIPGLLDIDGVEEGREFNELELQPTQYIPYAYHAIQRLAEKLGEQQAGGR